jgi:phage tail protein X
MSFTQLELRSTRRVLQTVKALLEAVLDAATGISDEGHFCRDVREISKRPDEVIGDLDKRVP